MKKTAASKRVILPRASDYTKSFLKDRERLSQPGLVVGAGPVGLTMACELARHGVSCRIVDKAPQPSDKSKALAVHARTIEIFENMGVVKEAIDRGLKIHGATVYHQGKRLLHFSLDEIESPYPFALMLPQSETESLLIEHLNRLGGKVERPVEVVSIKEHAQGVRSILRHADGKEEAINTPWLIGCDGAHSTIRHALNLTFEGAQYPERFALVDVDIEAEIPRDEISTYLHEDGVCVFFPLGPKRFRVIVDVVPGEADEESPTLHEFQSLLDRRGPGGIKINNPHWLTWFWIHRRSVSQYRRGPVFLAGDAAHIHSPVGGQGMNTGMHDAYNLAWKLALVVKGKSDSTLLDSYNEERHPVGQALLRGTDLATRVATLRHPIAQTIRNKVMSFLFEQDVIQHRMSKVGSMLAVNYRHSQIVGENRELKDLQLAGALDLESPGLPSWLEFGRGPLAGDRASDVVLFSAENKETRLYLAMQGTAHNLLLFDGKPTEGGYRNFEQICQAVDREYPGLVNVHMIVAGGDQPSLPNFAGKVWLDFDRRAHHLYAAIAECLYLVRPDGYIGFRSQPAKLKPLADYLSKIFNRQLVSGITR